MKTDDEKELALLTELRDNYLTCAKTVESWIKALKKRKMAKKGTTKGGKKIKY